MTHNELYNLLLWAMGGKVHPDAREVWSKFSREKAETFWLNYDWIKQKTFWEKASKDERLDVGLGGTFGNRVWIRRE